MQETKPIKRSAELTPLSKDHHDGLLLCWKIKQGLSNGIEIQRVLDYVCCSYAEELAPHFAQEEELVFSLLPDNDTMKIEALAQHDILNGMYTSMQDASTDKKALLQQFADELNNHIRYEERQLFPYIEKAVEASLLKDAGKKIDEIHQKHSRLVWNDEFWLRKK